MLNNNVHEFLHADDKDVEFIQKIIRRGRVHAYIASNLKDLQFAFRTDEEDKFTYALIKVRVMNNTYLFSGVAKRMTYGQSEDKPVAETGQNIALKRAMRSNPFVV